MSFDIPSCVDFWAYTDSSPSFGSSSSTDSDNYSDGPRVTATESLDGKGYYCGPAYGPSFAKHESDLSYDGPAFGPSYTPPEYFSEVWRESQESIYESKQEIKSLIEKKINHLSSSLEKDEAKEVYMRVKRDAVEMATKYLGTEAIQRKFSAHNSDFSIKKCADVESRAWENYREYWKNEANKEGPTREEAFRELVTLAVECGYTVTSAMAEDWGHFYEHGANIASYEIQEFLRVWQSTSRDAKATGTFLKDFTKEQWAAFREKCEAIRVEKESKYEGQGTKYDWFGVPDRDG